MNGKYHIHIESCMHAFNCGWSPITEKVMIVNFFYIEEEAPVVSVCNILISRYICPFCYACNLNST